MSKQRFAVQSCLPVLLSILLVSAVAVAAEPAAQSGPASNAPAGAPRNQFIQASDPRVLNRTYHSNDTNEEMHYSLFVSSKVSKDKKNPLIVTLHGLGTGPGVMMRGKELDLAEAGGYIMVAPMGYNIEGWYGSPVINMRKDQPVTPANLSELSEKDVLNVLDIIRKEFSVDANRTYLMGHSMGGAGTLFLGSKYASNWAAIAAIAPAAFMMEPSIASILGPLKSTMPIMIVQGDKDTLVPPANAHKWVDYMKENHMNYQYIEMPGQDHGSIIQAGMGDVFSFFEQHSKAAKK